MTLEERRVRFGKRLAGILAALAAVATFDPHLENFEFVTYGLYAFLPELCVLAGIAALVMMLRAGLLQIFARHWLLLSLAGIVIGWIALSMIQSTALESRGARRQDLKIYAEGLKEPIKTWAANRRAAYSTRQLEWFREDMRIRALDAFGRYEVDGAAAYLRAAKKVLGEDDFEQHHVEEALGYLAARKRYLENHRARIDTLAVESPMAPVRLYMMRAVQQLEAGDRQQSDELLAAEHRVHAAFQEASSAVRTCVVDKRVPRYGPDAHAVIVMVFEVLGDLPVPAPAPRSNPAEWCRALLTNPVAQKVGGPLLVSRFNDMSENLWGDALVPPALRVADL